MYQSQNNPHRKTQQNASVRTNKAIPLHSKKRKTFLSNGCTQSFPNLNWGSVVLAESGKQFPTFPSSAAPKQRKGHIINFSTFIVSYLFVGISSATSEKVIISSSETHLNFLCKGGRIFHRSKYLYFILMTSGSPRFWASQPSYLPEEGKEKRKSWRQETPPSPIFMCQCKKTHGEDRFFSPVPELLEVYTYRIILHNILDQW